MKSNLRLLRQEVEKGKSQENSPLSLYLFQGRGQVVIQSPPRKKLSALPLSYPAISRSSSQQRKTPIDSVAVWDQALALGQPTPGL